MSITRALIVIVLGLAVLPAGFVYYSGEQTRRTIKSFEEDVISAAKPGPLADDWRGLPAPVRRYFEFSFPDGPPREIAWCEMEIEGQFRRPLKDNFGASTGRQVVSVSSPDMVFSMDTKILGPLWATAYDVYFQGEMEMKARLLSAFTVVDESGSPELDRVSLRRWLLESPNYPMALLPGGPVTWEPIDDNQARAIVRAHGREASLIAAFRDDGSLKTFSAEQDGDLGLPYHGSGEYSLREEYELVDGVRLPMKFQIARAADGQVYPFLVGRIKSITFHAK